MDELLNKLIEIDKQARGRVEAAEQAKAQLFEELEAKKQKLIKKADEEYSESLEKERAVQSQKLEKEKARIEQSCREGFEALSRLYDEKCDEWVTQIVKNVTAG